MRYFFFKDRRCRLLHPPNYPVPRGRAAVAYIEDVILEMKRWYKDPFLVVGGDFNQWPLQNALDEFPDLNEVDVGPTRKDRWIDRIAINFSRALRASGAVPPLKVEPRMQGTKSDHRVPYVKASLSRVKNYHWESYSYRYRSPDAVAGFGKWLAGLHWAELAAMVSSNPKAECYQETVTATLETFFPLVTVHRKSSDCPWINLWIQRLTRKRRKIYLDEGRSAKWRNSLYQT